MTSRAVPGGAGSSGPPSPAVPGAAPAPLFPSGRAQPRRSPQAGPGRALARSAAMAAHRPSRAPAAEPVCSFPMQPGRALLGPLPGLWRAAVPSPGQSPAQPGHCQPLVCSGPAGMCLIPQGAHVSPPVSEFVHLSGSDYCLPLAISAGIYRTVPLPLNCLFLSP